MNNKNSIKFSVIIGEDRCPKFEKYEMLNIWQTNNIQIVKFSTKEYSKIVSNLNYKIDQKSPIHVFIVKFIFQGLTYVWIVFTRN